MYNKIKYSFGGVSLNRDNQDKKIELGKAIYNIRKKQNMSQEQFAEALGRTSGKVISRWECGMCKPTDETILLIEKKFNVSLKEFHSSPIQIIEKNNNKIVIILIIIIVITILGIILLLTTRERSYNLVSLDDNMSLNGVYIRKNHFSQVYINKVSLLNVENVRCYSIDTTIRHNDYVIYKYGNINLYEFGGAEYNELISLEDYLKEGNLFFSISSNTIKNPVKKTFTITFNCLKNRKLDVEKYKYEFIVR